MTQLALGLALLAGCASDERAPRTDGGSDGSGPQKTRDYCASPQEGCECADPGEVVDCGRVREKHGDYVTCSSGSRECTPEGTWGECTPERITLKPMPAAPAPGVRTLGLGDPAPCPAGFDPCDPYCNVAQDTPGNLDVGDDFDQTPTGLTPASTGVIACSALQLVPSVSQLTVTDFNAFNGASSPCTPNPPQAALIKDFNDGTGTWAVTAPGTSTYVFGGGTFVYPGAVTSNFSGNNWRVTGNISTYSGFGLYSWPCLFTDMHAFEGIEFDIRGNVGPTGQLRVGIRMPATATPADGGTCSGTCVSPERMITVTSTNTTLRLPFSSFTGGIPVATLDARTAALSMPYFAFNWSSGSYAADVTIDNLRFYGGIGPPVGFTLTATPPGCVTPPFNATWAVDKTDRAIIAGSNNSNALLTLAAPLGGPLRVTAYALGMNVSTTVGVKVNVLESRTSVSPNVQVATDARYATFGAWNAPAAGTIAAGVTWLYPYADTYFPLGLLPPVVQYWYTNTGGTGTVGSLSDREVKVSLRYPVNTSSNPSAGNYSDFNYSIIVRESNVVAQSAGKALDSRDPQVVIPDTAWRYFERTARGNYANIIVQRQRGAAPAVLENETSRRIYFVDGQLKGTVYYNSYSSPQGNNEGAILAIEPGLATPRLAVQPSGRCTVCHTVNLDGTQLISNGQRPDGSTNQYWMNQSRRFNISNSATFPSPPILQSYTPTADVEGNVPGDRYTFGGPWKDGQLYMTHGGCPPGATNGSCATWTGDPNWRAPKQFSKLFRVTDPNNAVAVTNWPANILAITPRFSPDGLRIAFGFSAGDSLSGIGPDTTGKLLTVMDFTCAAPPCNNSSTGWSVSNARRLTPTVASGINATTGTIRVAWPTFTPSGRSVIYQRQYRTSRMLSLGGVLNSDWSPSEINTVAGALAELWLSNVTTTGDSTPTRLLALNGLNSAGTPYLPEDIRSVSPLPAPPGGTTGYHRNAGAGFTIYQGDLCTNTGTATSVQDHRLNYLPSSAPTEAGGYSWVVFTSRRMYGSVAKGTPWEAKANVACYAGGPSTKKLWVAAIDRNPTPGTDPSHPAFYLPGQELTAGNSNAYWVNTPCAAVGAACSTSDDCCNGTGEDATTQCRVMSATTFPPVRQCQNLSSCSAVGEECSVTGDCCTGLTCPTGGGLCLREMTQVYEQQTLQREYVSDCPAGTLVQWRFFEWQATVPTGASLKFYAQTKQAPADTYAPATALLLGEATVSTPTGAWHRHSTPVHDMLNDATPQLTSHQYLRVTIEFNPNTGGSVAPTLHAWRQIFDCVPGQ